MVSVRQGAVTMMPLIAALERVILGRQLIHGGHPILRWNFENVETETNTYGHKCRFTKSKRHLCIDGAVASSIAVGRASLGEDSRSVYDDHEARPEGLLIFYGNQLHGTCGMARTETEQLVVSLEAWIAQFEKNFAKANATASRN